MDRRAENLRGSLLMIAAMAGFALEDMFIKAAAASLPVGQILILFGLGGMAAFAVMVRARREALLRPAALTPRLPGRGGAADSRSRCWPRPPCTPVRWVCLAASRRRIRRCARLPSTSTSAA